MRILLVEDTTDVADAIVAHLLRLGHTVDWEANGRKAANMVTDERYDLIILDVMLPELDGYALLKRIRGVPLNTQVLMLTACAEIEERVHALDTGADDYLTKPFDFRELEARIRVLLRRCGGDSTNLLKCANLSLDRKNRTAKVNDLPLDLTRREITLLEIIISHPGRIFGKDELIDKLFTIDDNPSANSVEQYIARLRKKLSHAQFEIRTLRGLGYQVVLS
ncbi:two-component system, OmpR family, response regulator TctD [Collimonas sp. OK242]|uniref:response regulator transcription factor n=1 Tax=Collimonas sp. OK242 TaxID=1798195 RepID=UPI00089944D5|nr:response regulator transcription factor [Collimonas sp. OK242]SDX22728.1 two-component system, OmpR family, response regulator TctD [Collimonas sp. OK242]